MQVLLMERGVHLDPAALRRECPSMTFNVARNVEEALPRCAEAEVLLAMAHDVSDALLNGMPRLRYLCALSAGLDHLETLTALRPDVRITSSRGIHGPQMSELAFLYMIALSRDFARNQRNQRNHLWERWPQHLLYRKTVAIAGIGPIAEEMAARCVAFGMRVIGVSDARTQAPHFEKLFKRAQLREAAREADFLIVLVPLSAETRHLIDEGVLAAMKPTAVLINQARGPLIDEPALIRCLQEGRIAGAGLDVFEAEPLPADSPLWDMPNVIITPRIGGMSDIYSDQVLPLVVHNLHCFAEGRLSDMKNVVRG
jgi:phosphoglycerate dehydrogenase-like enzyme